MTHERNRSTTQSPIATPSRPDGAAAAFIAALMLPILRMARWMELFRDAADEVGDDQDDDLHDNCKNAEAEEAALRNAYPDAVLHWNEHAARARKNGITFSLSAEAHHRAAFLDALDNPDAPPLLEHRHLTWVQAIDEDGYEATMDHPAARRLYRLKSQMHPSIYPPERNAWSAAQWREHERGVLEEFWAKCSPEARTGLKVWAQRINAERDAGTCTTSWRAPGFHGPRRRPASEPV